MSSPKDAALVQLQNLANALQQNAQDMLQGMPAALREEAKRVSFEVSKKSFTLGDKIVDGRGITEAQSAYLQTVAMMITAHAFVESFVELHKEAMPKSNSDLVDELLRELRRKEDDD